jgi:hypothetical protein
MLLIFSLLTTVISAVQGQRLMGTTLYIWFEWLVQADFIRIAAVDRNCLQGHQSGT